MRIKPTKTASRLLVISLLTASLAACGGGGGASEPTPVTPVPPPVVELTPAQKIAQLEASGVLPKLDRSADVKGPDANDNGVRDDIDAFIQSKYTTDAQRKAATQYASSLQKMLLVNVADPAAVRQVAVSISRGSKCLASRFQIGSDMTPFGVASRELLSVTTNTKPRLLASIAFSKAMDGSVISRPEGDTCE